MMVTGDHSMTGIAVSQQIGMLSKTQPIVVFDKEAPKKGLNAVTKPNSTDLPRSPRAPNSPNAATFVTSPLGNLEQKSPAPQRGFAQAQGRTAGSILGRSRISSSVTNIKAGDAAAFRASLRESKFALAEPAATPASTLGSDSDAITASAPASVLLPPGDSPPAMPASQAYPLHAPSLSSRPVLQGSAASSASTPEAVALAASSLLFKSSSLAPAPKSPSVAGSATVSLGAAKAAAKAPSPLLASYLKSMGGAKQSSNPSTSSGQGQSASAEQRSQTHSPDEPPSRAQSPLSPKLSRFSKVPGDSNVLSKGAPSMWSNQLCSPQCEEETEGVRLSIDSAAPESRSDSRSQLLPKSLAPRPPEFESQSRSQLHTETQTAKIQTQKAQTQTSTSDANHLLRSCLKASLQLQPPNQEVTSAESEFSQQKKKTSFDLRQWAVEQSRKQQSFSPQGLGLALSGLRHSLEMQSGHRNRSLDLVRADVKNMRLSFDSANLPSDEKLRYAFTWSYSQQHGN